MRPECLDHHHHERAIIHTQPVGATNDFVGGIPNEWAVDINPG
jgi:hypothetical protein